MLSLPGDPDSSTSYSQSPISSPSSSPSHRPGDTEVTRLYNLGLNKGIDVFDENEETNEGDLEGLGFPTDRMIERIPIELLSSYFNHQTTPLSTLPLHSCSTALYLLTPSDNFTTLLNSPLPSSYTSLFNPKHLTRHFLVFTDNEDDTGDAYVQSVKKKNPHCNITHLKINSNTEYDDTQVNLWSTKQIYSPNIKNIHYGGRLSPQNLADLRGYFSSILPQILQSHERSLTSLQSYVIEKRKGFKNLLKTFVTSKKSFDLSWNTYLLSIELFRLRAYTEAEYYASLVKNEYKSESNFFSAAGAGEVQLWKFNLLPGPSHPPTEPGVWEHVQSSRLYSLANGLYDLPNTNSNLPLSLYLAIARRHGKTATGDRGRELMSRIKELAGIKIINLGVIWSSNPTLITEKERKGEDDTESDLTDIEGVEEWYATYFKKEKERLRDLKFKRFPKLPKLAKGEVITVQVEVETRLGCGVDIESVELVCRLKGDAGVYWNGKKEEGEENEPEVGDSLSPTFGRMTLGTSPTPYFTTTPVSTSLKPSTKVSLSLPVTPLQMGKLEITGYRHKLKNCEAWFYMEWEKIEVEVIEELPSLEVQIEGVRERMNVGEIGEVKLRVKNNGGAKAEKLLIKSTLPYIYFPNDNEELSDLTPLEKVPNSVSPSGTLHLLPCDGLSAGEERTFTCLLRISIPGDHTLPLKLRYKSGKIIRSTSININVNVTQSLIFDANVVPSFKSGSEHVLSANVLAKGGGGRLNDIVVIGRGFKVVGVFDEETKSMDVDANSEVAVHAILGEEEESESQGVIVSSVAGGGEGIGGCFLRLKRGWEDYKRREQEERKKEEEEEEGEVVVKSIQEIRRAANAAKQKVRELTADSGDANATSLQAICPPSVCSMNVLLNFTTHAGLNVLFQSVEVRPSEFSASRCPFLVNAEYDRSVVWSPGGVERNVVVVVKNRVNNATPLNFAFEVGAPPGVEISGPTSFQSSLAGGEGTKIELRALYLRKGIFNLQRIRCVVGNVPFLFSFQWIVKVA
ncbi:hypothetical protein TrLO_g7985 [Triparma laevis f. longispina]|uniref:Uncharacterized protein n=1 Tax=Triparma laevis f. longispina TaxID=1714387 RepID=A0A9W7FJX7_9STRA|nr:hypothetical protein TrLO_g7985 [Triparma laevis f. longispina]